MLQLAAGGAGDAEIGQALDIKRGTAKNHMSTIIRRYGVSGRTQAVMCGILCGDVDELLAYAEVEWRRLE